MTVTHGLIDVFRASLLIEHDLCSGQIYVEIERARLTKTLANIKEQSGDVKEAASILQELQVKKKRKRNRKQHVVTLLEVSAWLLIWIQS